MRLLLSLISSAVFLIQICEAASSACIPKPTPKPNLPPKSPCAVQGTLKKPALVKQLQSTSGNYNGCYQACYANVKCKAFSYTPKSKQCKIYSGQLAAMGFAGSSTSGTNFWNMQGCFISPSCAVSSTKVPPTSTVKSTTTTTTTTPSASKTTTSKKPPKSTKTPKPTPPPIFGDDLPWKFSDCAIDPTNSAASFYLLDDSSGLPFVSEEGLVVLATTVSSSLPTFQFSPNPNGTNKVYDITFRANPDSTPQYLAIFSDGTVGFVQKSSNGQQFISDSTGAASYITTAFAVTCNGALVQGIVGQSPIALIVDSNHIIASLSSSNSTGGKSFTNPMLPRILPTTDGALSSRSSSSSSLMQRKIISTGDVPRCSKLEYATLAKDAAPAGSNGCGPAFLNHIADFDLGQCCNNHDFCYDGQVLDASGNVLSDDCQSSWKQCNQDFSICNQNTCDKVHKQGTLGHWGCSLLGRFYTAVVSSGIGEVFFHQASNARCACFCKYNRGWPCGCFEDDFPSSPIFDASNRQFASDMAYCNYCCTGWSHHLAGNKQCNCYWPPNDQGYTSCGYAGWDAYCCGEDSCGVGAPATY